jgi:hypothetical protein
MSNHLGEIHRLTASTRALATNPPLSRRGSLILIAVVHDFPKTPQVAFPTLPLGFCPLPSSAASSPSFADAVELCTTKLRFNYEWLADCKKREIHLPHSIGSAPSAGGEGSLCSPHCSVHNIEIFPSQNTQCSDRRELKASKSHNEWNVAREIPWGPA